LEKHMRRTSDEDRERIYKLHALGWSNCAIARKIGCSQSTVGRVLDPQIAERNREIGRAWREANPRYKRDWNAANIERRREYARAWEAAHPVKVAMKNARHRAERFGVPFNSDIEQYLGEIPAQCPVCHVEIVSHIGEGIQQSDSPSIDRRTPALGYVPGNVSWLCMRCNQIKHDDTMEDLIARRDRLTLAS
jgi:transposase-like protein